jgi:hypothetical protein
MKIFYPEDGLSWFFRNVRRDLYVAQRTGDTPILQRFQLVSYLLNAADRISSTMETEAACYSKTRVKFFRTTWHFVLEAAFFNTEI